jgi:hypothetical protein
LRGVIRTRVGSWWANWGKPGANANVGNSVCGADRKGSRCVVDPDPDAVGLAPARWPGPPRKVMSEHVGALPAGGPNRELTPNWDSAEEVAVAPPLTGSRCRRLVPAVLRTNADPAVLKSHGAARRRFWGAAPLGSSSRRPGQRAAGRTPYSCLVPPQRARPTTNFPGADWRAEVKRVREQCFGWISNPFPWKERGLTSEAI